MIPLQSRCAPNFGTNYSVQERSAVVSTITRADSVRADPRMSATLHEVFGDPEHSVGTVALPFSTECLQRRQAYSREVNARLAFMRGVVTYPKQILVPDETGITCVTTGRKLEEFSQPGGLGVQPHQRRANNAVVEPDRSHDAAIRQA